MEYFNFRHIMKAAGIPKSKVNNWSTGHALRNIAQQLGHDPTHILTKKTNPNPSVKAPHIIAHYPMEIFSQALEHVAQIWANSPSNDATQMQLFDERLDNIPNDELIDEDNDNETTT